MTTTATGRLNLGHIHSLVEGTPDSNLIGRVLYLQREHLLVVPLEPNHSQHWCAVLADLDGGRRPDYMNVATADLEEEAWRTIDPRGIDPEMRWVAWHARVAVAMWGDERWRIVRDVARIARVANGTNLAVYHAKTAEIIAATRMGLDELRRLLEELVLAGFLERCPDTPSSVGASLGTFHAIAEDLPHWQGGS